MRELFLEADGWGWASRAACADVDPLEFVQGGGDPTAPLLCLRCPVIRQCGQQADEQGELSGVWGGLDRRRLN